MNKRLIHIAPLQCGTVLAALYFCLSLLFVPLMLLPTMLLPHNANAAHSAFPLGPVFIVVFPFIYALLGFIFGIISALIYNLIAKMTGGLQFQVIDVPPGTREALDPMLD